MENFEFHEGRYRYLNGLMGVIIGLIMMLIPLVIVGFVLMTKEKLIISVLCYIIFSIIIMFFLIWNSELTVNVNESKIILKRNIGKKMININDISEIIIENLNNKVKLYHFKIGIITYKYIFSNENCIKLTNSIRNINSKIIIREE